MNIPVRDPGPPPGAQVLNYKFGPMRIQPGQNLINIDLQKERPDVNGYIVGFRPGLVYAQNGKSPSVKVVHLHHAVWLVGDSLTSLKPTFAAGEEKTYFNAPAGFGWRYTTEQTWVLNHMIHDLVASPQNVYLTYTLYFIPDTAPEAANITPIDTQWMDVQGIKPYPVFNAIKGKGTKTRSGTTEFTYPDQAPNAYKADGDRPQPLGRRPRRDAREHRRAPAPGRPVHRPAAHARRRDQDASSDRGANYFEPAGSVSWDVAMSATSDNWKVNVKKGDILSTSATYDTSRASWYEVMGIMVVGITKQPVPGGVDPFDPSTGTVDQTDYLTHGRLAGEHRQRRAQARTPACATRSACGPGPTRTGSSSGTSSTARATCPTRARPASRRRSARASR